MTVPLTVPHLDLLASMARNGPLPSVSVDPVTTQTLWALQAQGYVSLNTADGFAEWCLTANGQAALT